MLIATADLAAAVTTLLWTVPADKRGVFSVNLVNRTAASVTVRVAITTGAAPSDADWIEYETALNGQGMGLERTGLILIAGQRLYVRASAVGISAVAYGVIEELV